MSIHIFFNMQRMHHQEKNVKHKIKILLSYFSISKYFKYTKNAT